MIAAREVSVRDFAADPRLTFKLLGGESGLGRPVRHPRVQKNGLALAGHFHGVVPTRVQLLGETELSYLASLPEAERSIAVRAYLALGLSCIVLTKGATPPATLLAACNATGTPLYASSARTSVTINTIHAALDDLLAPTTTLHGVLVDVFGIGQLLLGKSGVGKSECALELVLRGHRLVADDVVECDYRPPGMIFGEPSPLLRDHIEIRGLGILNIRDMFGVTWAQTGGHDCAPCRLARGRRV
jgi:HPr kinase/phosphorylase